MKTKATTLMVLLVFLVSSAFRDYKRSHDFENDPASPDDENKFVLVRNEDDISLYLRWIQINETTSTRQVKADFVIDCPAARVVSVLCDEKTYQHWMKATKSCYRLKTIDQNQWYSYFQFSIPWPLNNQDCILKYQVREYKESSKTVINLLSDAGYLKPNKGIERISHMEGCWIITQLENGKTHVEYYVYSVQKPKFPTWMTDPLVQKNLIRTMSGLRNIAMNPSK